MSRLSSLPFLINTKYFKHVVDIGRCTQHYVYTNSINQRFFSQVLNVNKNGDLSINKFITFGQMISARKLEANRSILVQVQSSQSHKELYSYCSNLGTVKYMFHYSIGVEPLHFIIVEFRKEDDVRQILTNSCFSDEAQIVPVQSIFLWFKAPLTRTSKQKYSQAPKLQIENGTSTFQDNDIWEALQKSQSISEQMITLLNMTQLNDVGTRLRFLVAKQIESALSGLFPGVHAFPFGSSVNGYGKMGCDLDIVLRLHERNNDSNDSRLVFHSKASSGYMGTVADILSLFLPGCTQVRKILQARVPIIKYNHQLADIECDLSMISMSGVYMSELLYIFGEIDERVRPLVCTIRKWAKSVGLTHIYPGKWITNFSLTLMVLSFLQNSEKSPILPSINTLVKGARPEDVCVTEDGIICTFLRDINLLSLEQTNTDSLESLLQQFFEYYSQFDFTTKAICLNNSVPVLKPDHSPLYIVNPLVNVLNVSKNVSSEELEKLKMEMRNAAWMLESEEHRTSNWGVLGLFDRKRQTIMPHQKQNKLFEVSTLFEGREEMEVEYKNAQVEKQVHSVKKETKHNINKFAESVNRKKYGR